MAGGHHQKPYERAAEKGGRFLKEIQSLRPSMRKCLSSYISDYTNEDVFHDLIVCSYEAVSESGRFAKLMAQRNIESLSQKQKKEINKLYNPYRNISLDQCFGESRTVASEWLNVSAWKEWD